MPKNKNSCNAIHLTKYGYPYTLCDLPIQVSNNNQCVLIDIASFKDYNHVNLCVDCKDKITDKK